MMLGVTSAYNAESGALIVKFLLAPHVYTLADPSGQVEFLPEAAVANAPRSHEHWISRNNDHRWL